MDIREFKSALKPYRALIGFDYGAKRLGVAVSDLLLTVATSHKIIQRGSWEMNGEEGDIAKEGRAFAEKLQKATGLPVFFWDERLSSSAMENFLIKEVDMSRSKRRKVLDSSAAAYILQGALDALRFV